MAINIVKKFKLYKGYSGWNKDSGCRIVTGKRLRYECGFGAILFVLVEFGARTHRDLSESLGYAPNSFHDTLAWARANGVLAYDPKTCIWSATKKGERVLAAIVKNEDCHR